jgi:pSer/pThr/pTyr-binding forkhead associated (FHA) protein
VRRLLPLLLLLAIPADASKTRLRLERVEQSDDGLRVFASIVELEGQILDDRPAPAFELKVNGRKVGRATKLQRFQGSGDPLDLVLIVESSALYGPKPPTAQAPGAPAAPQPPPPPAKKGSKGSKGGKKAKEAGKKQSFKMTVATSGEDPIDLVKEAVGQLLEAMPPAWRVFVINYGEDVTLNKPWRPAGAAGAVIEDLSPEGEAADLKLIESVDAALIELKKQRAAHEEKGEKPARRLIVLISDGLNYNMDKNAFRTLGKSAAKDKVPIHTIAFSPQDDRGPLLNLGEISKLSNGTFRWARNVEDLHNQIETLADELSKQYVLTFDYGDSIQNKTFILSCGDLTSAPLKIGNVPDRRGLAWYWWVLIAAGVLGLIGIVLIILARRNTEYANFEEIRAQRQQQGAQPQAQAAAQPRGNAARIEASAAPQQPQYRGVARGTMMVVGGALGGTRVGIAIGSAPILIGKGPATLQITDDPAVSTRHAQVSGEQAGIVLTDLGSTNGTFVNNHKISAPTLLQDGDLVRVGNTQIKFRAE